MLANSDYSKIQVDEASTTVTYVGYSKDNFAADSAAVWEILKIEAASGASPTGVTTFRYGGTPGSFTNKWTDRAVLTYTS